jgi:hypothetical protein
VITGESVVCNVLSPAVAGCKSSPTTTWGLRRSLYAYACFAGPETFCAKHTKIT